MPRIGARSDGDDAALRISLAARAEPRNR